MIVIGADFVPTKSNYQLFEQGNVEQLFGDELLEILNKSDYRIFNLETPLSDLETPILKCGPNLIAPTATVNAYKAIHVDLLTIANNHILDQGKQGLASTRRVLQDNGIACVGVGDTLSTAHKPFFFEVQGKKYGVYACAEHEFSIATDTEMGANPFDPLESFDHIAKMKEQCDYVIVLYHGGKEHYRYPSPMLQKVCRKFVDKGASLVLCQHSHCIGCEEKYRNATIVYGQGNFLFDNSNHEVWQTGLLVCISEQCSIQYMPLVKAGNVVRMATGQKAVAIMHEFKQRSLDISQHDFIGANYHKMAKELISGYLIAIHGKRTIFFRIMNRLSKNKLTKICIRRKYRREERKILQDYIGCETLRELILEGIQEK